MSLSPHLSASLSRPVADNGLRDVGLPPRQYLPQVRVEQAKQYLTQKTIPITTLALELGFSSSQHFAATCKRLIGKSPRQHARGAQKGDFRQLRPRPVRGSMFA